MAATENKTAVNCKLSEENYSKKTLRKLQSKVCATLTCNVCPNYRCTSLQMYDEHMKSKKHLRRTLRKENENVWYCEACNLKLPNESEWVKHLTGQRHDKAMRVLAVQKIPTCRPITPYEIALLDKDCVEEDEDLET